MINGKLGAWGLWALTTFVASLLTLMMHVAIQAFRELKEWMGFKWVPAVTSLVSDWGILPWILVTIGLSVVGAIGIKERDNDWAIRWCVVAVLLMMGLTAATLCPLMLPFAAFLQHK